MSSHKIKFKLLLAFGALVLFASPARAELYKWVDAAGKTHYSDTKPDAAPAGTKELKVSEGPAPSTSMPDWKRKEAEFKRRQAARDWAQQYARNAPSYPQRQSGGVTVENDSARCSLARDVLSGAVRHTNGAVTDSKDIQVAQRDVAKFCG